MTRAIKYLFDIESETILSVIVMVYILGWSYLGEITIGLERIFFTTFASTVTAITQYLIPIILLIGYAVNKRKQQNKTYMIKAKTPSERDHSMALHKHAKE